MDFLGLIYKAARGLNVNKVNDSGKPKPAKKKKPAVPAADNLDNVIMEEGLEALPDDFRIYFPTHDTVARSKGGTQVSPPANASITDDT